MKYWVYINEEVLPQPYEAGELYTIKGFDGQTLICPEDVPEGEEQQWYTADELINYSASRPKSLAEAVAAASEENVAEIPVEEVQPQAEQQAQVQQEPSYMPSDEQEVYDASEDFTPEPLPDSYGKEDVPSSVPNNNELASLLLEKMELLISEVSGLKENISALNEKTSELAQKVEKVETGKNNAPIVKDYAALKAFKNQASAPLNENEIPEEQISLEESDEEKMPIITADPEDILESALENTMRLKAVSDVVAPVAFDLTSKETIQITDDEEPKPAEEKPEEPAQEQPEVKDETSTEEVVEEAIKEEPAVQEAPPSEQEEPVQEEVLQEEPAQEDFESVKIAPVGTEEEEEILKTFAQEKEDEQKEDVIKDEEVAALEAAVGIESVAEPVQETSDEVAFEQVETPAQEQAEENFPVEEQQSEESMPTEEEPAAGNPQEQYFEPVQEEQQSPSGEDALAALTSPSIESSQETSQVDAVDDKFLKTFSSSIDEISLDQPTSIISDYVPPAVTSDSPLYDEDAASQQQVQGMEDLKNQTPIQEDVRQVKRIKPAAIKTVPMVASGTPIGVEETPTNIEEAVTELNRPSPIVKGIKAFGLMIVLLFVVLGFVYVLALMGILSKDLSPIHYVLDKFTGSKVEETIDLQETTPVPASGDEEDKSSNGDDSDAIINTVKKYTFADGSTLEAKINALHGEDPDNIQWTAEPSVNPSYYQVVVTLPPNREGYNVTYRFNYDTENKELIPTTSESNNIMSMSMPSSARKK